MYYVKGFIIETNKAMEIFLEIIFWIFKLFFIVFILFFILIFVFSGAFVDMFKFILKRDCKNNKFCMMMKFIFVEYPAYLWPKFSIWKFLAFPYLLIYLLFYNKHNKDD